MTNIDLLSDGFYWLSSQEEPEKSLVKLYTYQDPVNQPTPIRLIGFGYWDGGGYVEASDLTEDSILEPAILSATISNLKAVKDTQGSHGNWNYSPYMLGLYNGLELAISILEDRCPDYRSSPNNWIADIEVDDFGIVETVSDN